MPKGLSPRVFFRKFDRITRKNWMRAYFLRRQRKRLDQVFGKYRPNKELCLSA